MRKIALLVSALCSGCAGHLDGVSDPGTHVERVLEDVSAMVEGMAEAHSGRRVVLRGPELRSSVPQELE